MAVINHFHHLMYNNAILPSSHWGKDRKYAVSNILRKLGVSSRTQAALYAIQIGLVPDGKSGI